MLTPAAVATRTQTARCRQQALGPRSAITNTLSSSGVIAAISELIVAAIDAEGVPESAATTPARSNVAHPSASSPAIPMTMP